MNRVLCFKSFAAWVHIVCGKVKCHLPQAEATLAINEATSGLYNEGLFLLNPRAEHLARKGLFFLRAYCRLAKMCFLAKKKRFPLHPKGHYLHHQFLELLHDSRKGKFSLNILVFSNQMSEDFVGKPSRLSRRVSAKRVPLRVLQRSFLAIRSALCSAFGIEDFELGTGASSKDWFLYHTCFSICMMPIIYHINEL